MSSSHAATSSVAYRFLHRACSRSTSIHRSLALGQERSLGGGWACSACLPTRMLALRRRASLAWPPAHMLARLRRARQRVLSRRRWVGSAWPLAHLHARLVAVRLARSGRPPTCTLGGGEAGRTWLPARVLALWRADPPGPILLSSSHYDGPGGVVCVSTIYTMTDCGLLEQYETVSVLGHGHRVSSPWAGELLIR